MRRNTDVNKGISKAGVITDKGLITVTKELITISNFKIPNKSLLFQEMAMKYYF